jgi:transmembrane sensor
MQIDKEYIDLIVNYLANEATNVEKNFLLEWLNEKSENQKEFDRIREIWISARLTKENKQFDKEKVWEQIQKRVPEIQTKPTLRIKKEPHYGFKNILKIAAVFVISFTIGLLVMYYVGKNADSNLTEDYEIITPLGSKTSIRLPDGSNVILNAGSKLIFPKKFNDKQRLVSLSGEAYFDIAKNPKKPFIVNTSDIDIKVLGTVFNVKAYSDEGTVETTIIRGSVSIVKAGNEKLKKPIILTVNQKATYIKSKGEIALSDVDSISLGQKTKTAFSDKSIKKLIPIDRLKIDNQIDVKLAVSWTNGVLIFKSEPLESIAKKLERKYNVTLIFEDEKLRKSKYTGTLRDLTLEQVLKVMEFTSPIEFRIVEKTVYLKSKKLNKIK